MSKITYQTVYEWKSCNKLAYKLGGCSLNFIYSEKATKFCKISTSLLTGKTKDKSKMEISQSFVAFSEYMSFKDVEDDLALKGCNHRII